MTLPFAVSIALLGLVQAGLVALPVSRLRPGWIARLDSPWWALVPALSIVVVIAAIEASAAAADALTYIALIAVPPLAAYALANLTRDRVNPRIWRVHAVSRGDGFGLLGAVAVAGGLFALAWGLPDALAGEAAATALSGLSCVTLGWLLVCGVPAGWLRLGVYAMAAIDAAAPAAGLPQLQAVHFGSAQMGFGDLFVAGLVGCLLAAEDAASEVRGGEANRQLLATVLVAVLALAFDLLFFAVDTLPATVPVAVTLALVSRRRTAQL